jgi:hypothetical protein
VKTRSHHLQNLLKNGSCAKGKRHTTHSPVEHLEAEEATQKEANLAGGQRHNMHSKEDLH